MKTLNQFLEEANEMVEAQEIQESEQINEAADIELKPHPNGTHYIVHKIHPASGIESDQLKQGEKISDSDVDDLKDMYKVKIHSK
jgi:hypothetical protein